jgi:hypothetical protein
MSKSSRKSKILTRRISPLPDIEAMREELREAKSKAVTAGLARQSALAEQKSLRAKLEEVGVSGEQVPSPFRRGFNPKQFIPQNLYHVEKSWDGLLPHYIFRRMSFYDFLVPSLLYFVEPVDKAKYNFQYHCRTKTSEPFYAQLVKWVPATSCKAFKDQKTRDANWDTHTGRELLYNYALNLGRWCPLGKVESFWRNTYVWRSQCDLAHTFIAEDQNYISRRFEGTFEVLGNRSHTYERAAKRTDAREGAGKLTLVTTK